MGKAKKHLSIGSWYMNNYRKGCSLASIPENEITPEMCFAAVHYWGPALEYVPEKYIMLNRGLTLLVDNRNVESLSLRAPYLIQVTVNKSEPLEFFRGDHEIYKVGGGRHRICIEFNDRTPPLKRALHFLLDRICSSFPFQK